METPSDQARESEEAERVSDREPTVIELMNGPKRPTERRRKTVLWIALAFATAMLAMTFAVIALYGLDFLTIFTAALLIVIVAAMAGALRYKGEDPMAQFEPHDDLRPRPFGRTRK